MKKFAYILAGVAAVFGLSSCEDDKEPVYTPPTADSKFVLNEPALGNEQFTLTPETVLEFTCSQPDYGFSAITHYGVEVSLTEDFADYREVQSEGTGTTARIFVKGSNIAVALCELHGWASKDEYVDQGNEKIYFRVTAELSGIEGSRLVSNVVSYNKVQSYYAVLEPGRLYVVGAFSNGLSWDMGASVQQYIDARQVLNETGAGTGVYTGIVPFPAGETYFRLYTDLGDWGKDGERPSIGANAVDGDNTAVVIGDEPLMVPAVDGKGAWYTQGDFAGGDVTMIFDMNAMQLTLIAGAQSVTISQYVYMVGNNAGWATPDESSADIYNAWRLEDSSDSGVYSATFDLTDLPADDLYCRFYKELAGWGPAQWAGNENDGDNYEVTPGEETRTVAGEGCFMLPGVKGKVVSIVLDTNTNTVTFNVVE